MRVRRVLAHFSSSRPAGWAREAATSAAHMRRADALCLPRNKSFTELGLDEYRRRLPAAAARSAKRKNPQFLILRNRLAGPPVSYLRLETGWLARNRGF